MTQPSVMRSPMLRPMMTEPSPENIPFSTTICIGSLDEIILVQLFSMPQQTQASKINSEPYEKRRPDTSSSDSRAQATSQAGSRPRGGG